MNDDKLENIITACKARPIDYEACPLCCGHGTIWELSMCEVGGVPRPMPPIICPRCNGYRVVRKLSQFYDEKVKCPYALKVVRCPGCPATIEEFKNCTYRGPLRFES